MADRKIDRAGAAMLNSTRKRSRRPFENQQEMMRPSKATMSAPAAGPWSSTDVKTNVSEMEIVAGTEGSLIVAEPLSNVRAARRNQLPGFSAPISHPTELRITANPAPLTRATYSMPARGSWVGGCGMAPVDSADTAGSPRIYRPLSSKRLWASLANPVSCARHSG